ncbi:unnamed protein product [Pieris macdunnoughi]|uniref:Uncharacterized protein n=1 Tax=Pieris macdunnoughi TaxID=345717 RepID=A0A821VKE1_9NEOP|nr:unnamed protein product [Pieris macdunnoughi]
MFYKLFIIVAMLAGALAAPSPQYLTYTAGLDYIYPGNVPSAISPYSSSFYPLSYGGYPTEYYLRRK